MSGNKLTYRFFLIAATAIVAVTFLAALAIGRFPVEFAQVFQILSDAAQADPTGEQSLAYSVVFNIRLPRVLIALVGGIGLGVSGAVFQGIFRNPLVSPGVIGVTAGAGFGASMGILICGWGPMTQLFGFGFGAVALAITWTVAKRSGSSSLLVFVLAGVIVNMFFQAMISLVKFLADAEEKLPSIVYWLMGSLASASWRKALFAIPVILISSAILILMRRTINLLSLGSETVRGLGVDPRGPMAAVLVLTTLSVSAVVSVAGIVGWIGLVVPHITRMIIGPDHERLLPGSALVGAGFFVVVDTVGRTISPQDIPLGILTALIGAPIFVTLLIRSRGRWAL
jgi:iron complex transport system permease protein